MTLNIFNMDKQPTSLLIDVNMVITYTLIVLHLNSIVEPIFEQILEDELMLLDELAYTNLIYGDTSARVPITRE